MAVLVADLLNVLHVPAERPQHGADESGFRVLLAKRLPAEALQPRGGLIQAREKSLPE